MAKKLKNEKALLAEALRIIKAIAPLPADKISLPNMRHRLAMWVTHKLPPDHDLLK
jgi:hypothetical protein